MNIEIHSFKTKSLHVYKEITFITNLYFFGVGTPSNLIFLKNRAFLSVNLYSYLPTVFLSSTLACLSQLKICSSYGVTISTWLTVHVSVFCLFVYLYVSIFMSYCMKTRVILFLLS